MADTPALRSRGLMGVTDLGDIDGMLFRWPSDVESGFWMKDTLIPLDIAFFAADGSLVDLLSMVPCEADPCPSYRPSGPYRSALEVEAGGFDHLDGVDLAASVGPTSATTAARGVHSRLFPDLPRSGAAHYEGVRRRWSAPMRAYELMTIFRPEMAETEVRSEVTTIEAALAAGGAEVKETDFWGKRRFAYEIEHLQRGLLRPGHLQGRSRRHRRCRPGPFPVRQRAAGTSSSARSSRNVTPALHNEGGNSENESERGMTRCQRIQ